MHHSIEYCFLIWLYSASIATIWFKSPAFVSAMQILSFCMRKLLPRKYNDLEVIYTDEDAVIFCINNISSKLATLLSCIVCFSFWFTLILSSIIALIFNLSFLFVITCAVVSPMLNYFILEILLTKK